MSNKELFYGSDKTNAAFIIRYRICSMMTNGTCEQCLKEMAGIKK